MSTRSLTTVRSKHTQDESYDTHHATIYRHWDGDLSGQGQFLANFLRDITVGNGRRDSSWERYANGPDRLAAALVTKMTLAEMQPGLIPPGADLGQEFHYVVDVCWGGDVATITVTVFDGPMTYLGQGDEDCSHQVFSGTVEEFVRYLEHQAARV